MIIELLNTFSSVFAEGDLLEEVKKVSSVEYIDYQRRKGQRYPKKQKRTMRLWRKLGGGVSVPTGLLGYVSEKASALGEDVVIKDMRRILAKGEKQEISFQLRDYQKEAVTKSLFAQRGIVWHPTGSGKTLTAAYLVGNIGLETLYLVPNLTLLEQTERKFEEWFGAYVGKVGEGVFNPKLFTIATPQTIWSRFSTKDVKSLLARTKVLVIDEAHHVGRANNRLNTWYRICSDCEQARWRFGFTATPGEDKDVRRKMLEAQTGRVIHCVSSKKLERRGYLSKAEVKMYVVNAYRKEKVRDWESMFDWGEIYKECILTNEERNDRIVEVVKELVENDKRVLVCTFQVEKHGKLLAEKLGKVLENGLVRFVYGQTPSEERKQAIREFEGGNIKVLVGTVFGEGVDIPEMNAVVLAGAGRSRKVTIQQLGRVLRCAKGKEGAIIIDFYDQDGGILERHSGVRKKVYESEGYEVEMIERKEGQGEKG